MARCASQGQHLALICCAACALNFPAAPDVCTATHLGPNKDPCRLILHSCSKACMPALDSILPASHNWIR